MRRPNEGANPPNLSHRGDVRSDDTATVISHVFQMRRRSLASLNLATPVPYQPDDKCPSAPFHLWRLALESDALRSTSQVHIHEVRHHQQVYRLPRSYRHAHVRI